MESKKKLNTKKLAILFGILFISIFVIQGINAESEIIDGVNLFGGDCKNYTLPGLKYPDIDYLVQGNSSNLDGFKVSYFPDDKTSSIVQICVSLGYQPDKFTTTFYDNAHLFVFPITRIVNPTVYNNETLNLDIIDVLNESLVTFNIAEGQVISSNFNINSSGFLKNITPLEKGTKFLTIIIKNKSQTIIGSPTIVLTILGLSEEHVTEPIVTIDNSTDTLVFNSESDNVSEIIIPPSVDDNTEIILDMGALVNTTTTTTNLTNGTSVNITQNTVTTGSNNISLERQAANNYTANIPAGTTITGNSSWDGKLILPTIVTLPSSQNVSVAVRMGTEFGTLKFDKAVQIIIGGMAGKSALYQDSSGAQFLISPCSLFSSSINENSSGNLSVSNGECFLTSGNDLIIWTYHFTIFAAYTPTPGENNNAGGGVCSTQWSCNEWSECVNGQQIRVCSYPTNFCKPTDARPKESQYCNSSIINGQNSNQTNGEQGTETANQGGLFGITGAAIGNFVSSPGKIVLIVLVISGLGLAVFFLNKKNKKKKQDKDETDQEKDAKDEDNEEDDDEDEDEEDDEEEAEEDAKSRKKARKK